MQMFLTVVAMCYSVAPLDCHLFTFVRLCDARILYVVQKLFTSSHAGHCALLALRTLLRYSLSELFDAAFALDQSLNVISILQIACDDCIQNKKAGMPIRPERNMICKSEPLDMRLQCF